MKTLCAAALLLASSLYAGPISATVFLEGGSFLQSGSVTNTSPSDVLTGFIYSFGPAASGIATWDSGTGGGTASDFLSNPQWFQTVTFSGLAVAPGGVFNFSGLDIDFIATLAPLSINEGTIDNIGTTLQTATVTALFGDRAVSGPLNITGWTVNQGLRLSETNAVPEPSSYLLLGVGIAGIAAFRRTRVCR